MRYFLELEEFTFSKHAENKCKDLGPEIQGRPVSWRRSITSRSPRWAGGVERSIAQE